MNREDLPRLTDDERESLDDCAVMAGVPRGEKPAHTPGPWTLRKNSRGEECGAVLGADGMLVATTGYRASPLSNEDDANAHLIAAAPDMKAVLDELEDSFDKEIYPEQATENYDAPDDREYTVTITAKQWRALGRALSKAEGRS